MKKIIALLLVIPAAYVGSLVADTVASNQAIGCIGVFAIVTLLASIPSWLLYTHD